MDFNSSIEYSLKNLDFCSYFACREGFRALYERSWSLFFSEIALKELFWESQK